MHVVLFHISFVNLVLFFVVTVKLSSLNTLCNGACACVLKVSNIKYLLSSCGVCLIKINNCHIIYQHNFANRR